MVNVTVCSSVEHATNHKQCNHYNTTTTYNTTMLHQRYNYVQLMTAWWSCKLACNQALLISTVGRAFFRLREELRRAGERFVCRGSEISVLDLLVLGFILSRGWRNTRAEIGPARRPWPIQAIKHKHYLQFNRLLTIRTQHSDYLYEIWNK